MTWAQRLKRVFSVDIEVCGRCGGSLKVIVGAPNRCIEDQDIIPGKAGQALDRILAHLREKEQEAPARPLLVPPTRAPPATLSLFAGSELQTQSAKTPLKNPWHGLLRALVQEWTDMNCEITSASNVSGPCRRVFRRISPAQLAASVRKPTPSRPFICPVLIRHLQVVTHLSFWPK